MSLELKGRWHNRDKSVTERQTRLRAQVSPATVVGDAELRYLVSASGEIVQVLPSDEDEPTQTASSE